MRTVLKKGAAKWQQLVRNAADNAYREADIQYRDNESGNRSSVMQPNMCTVQQKVVFGTAKVASVRQKCCT